MRIVWLLAAALPLAAQPKLLINAQVDTRPASAGLEPAFRALLSTRPQPAWIGYSVPSVRAYIGCEYVYNESGPAPGVVHLEPPDHVIVLFRVENNAVERIRTVSPDCEIDAGGVPVHWLTDVQPAQSIALLATLATQRDFYGDSAMHAIALHAGPEADAALERFLAANQPESVRARAVMWFGSARGHEGFEVLKKVIAADPDERVRERAISVLANSKETDAPGLLIGIAKSDSNARLRAQAVGALGRKPGPQTAAVLTGIVENDPDQQVKRRAVSALESMPDGEGIPILIRLAKTSSDAEVRRQAMSRLGNSRDPRALAFLEDVLKH